MIAKTFWVIMETIGLLMIILRYIPWLRAAKWYSWILVSVSFATAVACSIASHPVMAVVWVAIGVMVAFEKSPIKIGKRGGETH
jgi:hypothetical protein